MQKCHTPIAWFLCRKTCIDAGYPRNVKTCSSEAFHLLATPHAPGNLSHRISCTAAEHRAGNPGTRSELWASSRMWLSYSTHSQHWALQRHQPSRQYKSSKSDASTCEPIRKGHFYPCFSLQHRSGWCQHATHNTSTGKVSLLQIRSPKAWTISCS